MLKGASNVQQIILGESSKIITFRCHKYSILKFTQHQESMTKFKLQSKVIGSNLFALLKFGNAIF